MIKTLRITNFIIVKELNLELDNDLIVLTGETGAGKSVIAGAIDNLFGGQTKPGSLFNESDPAIIEITVDLDQNNQNLLQLLKKYEFDPEENEIFFRKEINPNLRGKIFLNGRRISNQIVKEFREILLDFHSQRDQQRLFDSSFQLEVVDAFAGLTDTRNKFNLLFNNMLDQQKKLTELLELEKSSEERIKLYEFQLQEIKALQLKPEEDIVLQKELNLLLNSQDIINNSIDLEQTVYENENSIYDIINGFLARFREYAADNDHLKSAVELLENSLMNIDEAVGEIRKLLDHISVDEERQIVLEQRLNEINSARQKYKMDIEDLLIYADKIKYEISNFSSNKKEIEDLRNKLEADRVDLYNKAELLSKKRKEAALKLVKKIKVNIRKLAIPEADIEIRFNQPETKNSEFLSGLNPTGMDEVEIYFTANKGIKMQSLKFAASGGELSRFLLTIKKILTDNLENRTIIFDEIDAGIGGKTADMLGEFIDDISKYHQILCVTHLAQIAVYAKKHYNIFKKSNRNNSEVIVIELNASDRKEEIARMLSGSKSELALKYAEEILSRRRN